tara:strand:- start:541 stop:918 length:378 start_codon:yes stop_codon:yes gene_type:complete
MSVRIVRTKNGEDIICDLYEVTTKEEPDKAVAFQLSDPYSVWLNKDANEQFLVESDGEEIAKQSSPEVVFEPWAPLARDRKILLKLDEVVTAYETYDEIIEKYSELMEAVNGRESSKTSSVDTEE